MQVCNVQTYHSAINCTQLCALYAKQNTVFHGIFSYSIYLSIFIRPIKDNLNAIGHAVGQDSETKSTEHCSKYKQSTVI